MKSWYVGKNSNSVQGLVIDEVTGANIAVTYDIKDARLIASAPDLYAACVEAASALSMSFDDEEQGSPYKTAFDVVMAAIEKSGLSN